MATTKIVLLSDSTNGWFYRGQQPLKYLPEHLYGRYGRTVRAGYNGSYASPTWVDDVSTDLDNVWFGGGGADEIHLYNNGPGGACWDDVDANAVQECVTDINPDIVIVAFGINCAAATLQAGLEGLYDAVAAAVPTASIIFCSQNPTLSSNGSADWRDAIQAAAASKGATFVDVYQEFIDTGDWELLLDDAVHPNGDGLDLYASTVDAALLADGLLGAEQEGSSSVAIIDSAELVLRANRYSGSGVWQDESGNGHHATPVGSPTWDGEKFALNGIDQYFTIPDADGLDPALSDFTVVVVATASAAMGPSGQNWLLAKRVGAPYWNLNYSLSTSALNVNINDGTSNAVPSSGPNTAPQGTRFTAAFTIDRTAGELRMIVVDAGSGTADISGFGTVASAADMGIGIWTTGRWNGDIYGVAIFTTALSDADVEAAGVDLVASATNRMGGTGAIRRSPVGR